MSEEKVPKISMDLHVSVDNEYFFVLVRACQEILFHLGKAGRLVEAFRITFFSHKKDGKYGPKITAHITDPFNQKTFFTSDYNFMSKDKKIRPSIKEIVEEMLPGIKSLIRERIERNQKELIEVEEMLEDIKE